jgi:two-component system, cell cycle sensor histidine kinase PleC
MMSFVDISASAAAYEEQQRSDQERLDQWRMQNYFRNLPFNLAGLTIGSIIAVVVFWAQFQPTMLIGWLCVHSAMIGYRGHHYLQYREQGIQEAELAQWRRAALTGALMGGIVWSAAVLLLMPGLDLTGRMLLTFLIGGFSATAVGITSVFLPSLYAWILTAQLTVTLGTFATATSPTGFSMAVMMTFFTVALLFFGNSSSRSMRQSFEDANRQAALQTEVNLLEARTRSAIEHMPAAVAMFDSDDRLLIWNRRAVKLFPELKMHWRPGVPFTELVRNSSVWQSLGEDSGGHQADGETSLTSNFDTIMAERLRRHREPENSWEVAIEDGRWLQAQEARMPDGSYLTIYVDITSLKEQEYVLRIAKEEAEHASQSKSRFLALMSHELRTPLNAILGFAQGIEKQQFGSIDMHYVDYASVIRESGEHLLSVINDILDLSKIEAGHFKLAPEKLEPARSLQAALRILKERASEAGLKVVVRTPSQLPNFYADARAVHQMLLNLLSNAIKFTPSGGTISLEAAMRGDELLLCIRDTGIGIAPENIKAVLQPFGQVDDTLRRKEQGTGLGVPLTNSLMELHGGRLEIRSEPGKGTSMTLVFPADCIAEMPVATVTT